MDGRNRLNAARPGGINTVLPIDRSLTSRTRSMFDQSSLFVSLFNHRLINEHYRDVVTNRVEPFALGAFQAAHVGFWHHFNLADRACQYFEQPLAYRHLAPPGN